MNSMFFGLNIIHYWPVNTELFSDTNTSIENATNSTMPQRCQNTKETKLKLYYDKDKLELMDISM